MGVRMILLKFIHVVMISLQFSFAQEKDKNVCKTSISIDPTGIINFESSGYAGAEPEYGNLKIVDDDGLMAVMALTGKIAQSKLPYVITNDDKRLLADSVERAKKYWSDYLPTSTDLSLKDFSIAVSKLASENTWHEDWSDSVDDADRYLKNLTKIEEVLSQKKINEAEFLNLQGLLKQEADMHKYEVIDPSHPYGGFSMDLCPPIFGNSDRFGPGNVVHQNLCSSIYLESEKTQSMRFDKKLSCEINFKKPSSGSQPDAAGGVIRQ